MCSSGSGDGFGDEDSSDMHARVRWCNAPVLWPCYVSSMDLIPEAFIT